MLGILSWTYCFFVVVNSSISVDLQVANAGGLLCIPGTGPVEFLLLPTMIQLKYGL